MMFDVDVKCWGLLVKATGCLAIAASIGACSEGSGISFPPAPQTTTPPQTGNAPPAANNTPAPNVVQSAPLTGVFIDSPVSNLSYKAGSLEGKTNDQGEFQYRAGDTVQFSIGNTNLPEIQAKSVVTPLDVFSTEHVTHDGVVNLSRLLQTLDADNNAENGIHIGHDADAKLSDVQFDLMDRASFDDSIERVLVESGITVNEVVARDRALTHLSNSLLNNNLIDISALQPLTEASIDDASGELTLVDTDGDGAADIFDTDDDNDNIPDTFDEHPLVSQEGIDAREFGVVVEVGKAAVLEVAGPETVVPESVEEPDTGQAQEVAMPPVSIAPSSTDDTTADIPNVSAQLPLSEQIQGNWLQECTEAVFTSSPGYNFVRHSEIIGDSEIRSIVAFYQDEDCRYLARDDWREAMDIHIFDVEYGANLLLGDGTTTLTYKISNVEALNLSLIGISFFPNNLAVIEDGVAYFGITEVTNVVPGINWNDPYFPVSELPEIGFLADLGVTDLWVRDPDYAEKDRDYDGVPNQYDQLPDDPLEFFDFDKDGIGNNADPDDDNDGIPDLEDANPFDATYGADTDGDGIDNHTDPDDDNDGTVDSNDAFPRDPDETSGFDGDNIGDNADWDDDGDGIGDENDAFSPAFTFQMDSPWIKIERYRPSFDDFYYPAYSMRQFMSEEKRWGRHEVFFDQTLDTGFRILTPVYATSAYLYQREVNVAIEFESQNDARAMSVIVEGVLLSMAANNPRSVRITVPSGALTHARYADTDGVVTVVTEEADSDLFASAEDGAFSLDFGSIERKLNRHGYNNFLTQTGHFTVITAMTGVDFDIDDSGVVSRPEQYEISVGDITVSGYGVKGYLTNRSTMSAE
jgi:hypothetical protein